VSVLLGSTFAWFTDEVVSGENMIAAGNLDVELYNDAGEVDENTKLFEVKTGETDLWEPGVVRYENLTVKNVGSLALKYDLAVNVAKDSENWVTDASNNAILDDADNKFTLSQALKVGVVPGGVKGTTRDEVMLEVSEWKSLESFVKSDVLEANAESDTYGIVIAWVPGNNDNNWNVNNGKQTNDGNPLHINLGVKLFATQQVKENDSFGPDYDENAPYPKSLVVRAPQYENIGLDWGSYGSWSPSNPDQQLEAAYVFQALDTVETAGDYADWYCDYYVYADTTIPEGKLFLGGNYDPFGWVGFENPEEVEAGTVIPLLGSVGGSWTYADIIQNVGTFICGVADIDDALVGTTFTVELRLTNPEDETDYKVISKIDYTFAKEVDNVEDLSDAIDEGAGYIALAAGEYKMPSITDSKEFTITGTKDTVIDVTLGAYMENSKVSFEGVTIKTSTGYANGNGSDYAALYTPNVTYTDCTFVGPMRVGRDGAKFINCTFTALGNDYVWTYGNDVTFENCTFNTDGKAILIYSDGGNEVAKVKVEGCTFNATTGAKAGAIANQNCAAIEIHNYGNGVNLTTSGNTYDSSNFSGEWRIKTYESGKPQVFVNGTEYNTIALDGKTMTIDADKNVTVNV